MEANTKEIEWLLDNVTQYQISKDTGVSQSALSNIKNGNRKIENLTIVIGAKLTDYAKKIKNNDKNP